MNEDRETKPAEEKSSPLFFLGNLDTETIEILVEDKIATGG